MFVVIIGYLSTCFCTKYVNVEDLAEIYCDGEIIFSTAARSFLKKNVDHQTRTHTYLHTYVIGPIIQSC